MLDECKGDRLEEVLAAFSSAVLKKLVAERSLNGGLEFRPTISEKLALENWGYTGDRTTLNVLILAHRVSLSTLLADKNTARQRYKEFEQLLSLKETILARRREQASRSWKADERVSDSTTEQVRRILKTNWTGNERWIDSLLYSDTNPSNGGFLSRSFDDIWTDVEDGRVADLEDHNDGLLDQLDERVRLQKTRLQKWNGYRERMFGTKPPASPHQESDVRSKKCVVQFNAHKKIAIDEGDRERVAHRMATFPAEYADILDGVKADFESMKKAKTPDIASLLKTSAKAQPSFGGFQSLSMPTEFEDPIPDEGELEDEPTKPEPAPKPLRLRSTRIARFSQTVDFDPPTKGEQPPQPRSLEIKADRRTVSDSGSEGELPKRDATTRIASRISRPPPLPPRSNPESRNNLPAQPAAIAMAMAAPARRNISPDISPMGSPLPEEPAFAPPPPQPSPPQRQLSPTQAMADQILASMSNASPSPAKKPRYTLSLAERARMSMSRGRAYSQEDEELDPLLSPTAMAAPTGRPAADEYPRSPSHTHTKSAPANPAAAGLADADAEGGETIDGYEDLVARTRRSMAGYEAARQKAQLERRRSLRRSRMPQPLPQQRRGSQFPRLDEDGADADASIVEELLDAGAAGDVDMETVFRSRPKIAASPPMSPAKLAWDDAV